MVLRGPWRDLRAARGRCFLRAACEYWIHYYLMHKLRWQILQSAVVCHTARTSRARTHANVKIETQKIWRIRRRPSAWWWEMSVSCGREKLHAFVNWADYLRSVVHVIKYNIWPGLAARELRTIFSDSFFIRFFEKLETGTRATMMVAESAMMQRYVFDILADVGCAIWWMVMMMLADAMTRFIPDRHQINNKNGKNI